MAKPFNQLIYGWLICLFLLLGQLFYCNRHQQKLSQREIRAFSMVYSAYLAAIASDTLDANKADAKLQQLLEQANMTKETFTKYQNMLENDPQAFKQMLDMVNENLQKISSPPKH